MGRERRAERERAWRGEGDGEVRIWERAWRLLVRIAVSRVRSGIAFAWDAKEVAMPTKVWIELV